MWLAAVWSETLSGSMLPPEAIEVLRRALRGERLVPAGEAQEIERSRPHGHVAAVLGTLRRLGLESLLAPQPSRQRDLAVAMIVARALVRAPSLRRRAGWARRPGFTRWRRIWSCRRRTWRSSMRGERGRADISGEVTDTQSMTRL
jgi:hypothetical protein